MKLVGIFLFASILLLITGANASYGLQQAAGKIVAQLKPGETKTVQWGLLSDNKNNVTTVELKADGKGAEFLSFPKTVLLNPGQLEFINITVTVPSNFTQNIELNPSIYATEFGEKGGATIMNIQMEKVLTIRIGNPPEAIAPTQQQASAANKTIPEFGPMAAIVLAASVISIIALSMSGRSVWLRR